VGAVGVEEGRPQWQSEASAPAGSAAYVLEGRLLQPDGKVQRLAEQPAIVNISTPWFSQFDVDEGQNGLETRAICVRR